MGNQKTDLWMPWYIGDYLRDTMHLTTEQHGAYLLLIAHYWVTGKPLPDDDEYLSNTARCMRDAWAAHRPRIAAFFQIADGKWVHKRIEAELESARKHNEARTNSARKAAYSMHAKRKAMRTQCDSHAPRMPDAVLDACPEHVPSPSQITHTQTASNEVSAEDPPPTLAEVLAWGKECCIPEPIDEDYCREYHHKKTVKRTWFTGNGLIDWKADIKFYWDKDKGWYMQKKNQSRQSNGLAKSTGRPAWAIEKELKDRFAAVLDQLQYEKNPEKRKALQTEEKELRAKLGGES